MSTLETATRCAGASSIWMVQPKPGYGEHGRLRPLQRVLLAAEVLATYASVRWMLRGRTIEELVVALRERQRSECTERDEQARFLIALRLANAVVRTLRVIPADSRCLMRSLVLTRLLARRGISASIVIGVRHGGEFAAHAWVEHVGRPLLPSYGEEYGRLVEL